MDGKATGERGASISAILGWNEAKEEAEGGTQNQILTATVSFKRRFRITKPSKNKLSPKRVHGEARAAAAAGECLLYGTFN